MLVLLDGERLEPTLPDVAAAAVAGPVAADMGRKQPHHVVAQVAVAAGPDDQMEVVGHETPRQQSDRGAVACPAEQFNEGAVVGVGVEHGAAAVAAVEDVVTVAAEQGACGPGHGGIVLAAAAGRKKKGTMACARPVGPSGLNLRWDDVSVRRSATPFLTR